MARLSFTLGSSLKSAQNKAVTSGARTGMASFSCFGVLITGAGIDSLDPDVDGIRPGLPSSYCSYPGISSNFVVPDSVTTFDLKVPAGAELLIQVVAMDYPSGGSCPSMTVGEFLKASRQGTTSTLSYGGLFEVGRKVATVNEDAVIDVPNTYDSGNKLNLKDCVASSAANALHFSVTGPIKARVGEMRKISASGGTPPYTYTTVAGSYDVSHSIYTTDTSVGTNKLTVTDNNGATRTLTIEGVSGTSLGLDAKLWYSADTFLADGTGDRSLYGATWTNLGNAGYALAQGGGTPDFYVSAGPQETPAVRFQHPDTFFTHYSTLNLIQSNYAHTFVVLRSDSDNVGAVFCVTAGSDCYTTSNTFFGMVPWGNSSSGGFLMRASSGSTNASTAGVIPDSHSWTLAEASYESGTAMKYIFGGSAEFSPSPHIGSAILNGSITVILGKGTSAGGFKGYIAEVIQLLSNTTPIPVSATDAYRSYLKSKYSLP